MDERMLRAMVEAGAIKHIDTTGARSVMLGSSPVMTRARVPAVASSKTTAPTSNAAITSPVTGGGSGLARSSR